VAKVCCPVADEILVMEHVAALVNWGLLLRQGTQDELHPRLGMLETIREYAWNCLVEAGELDATQRAHALTFLALVEDLEPGLLDTEQTRHFAVLDAEQDNIRAALHWALVTAERKEQVDSAHGDIPASEVALRLACAMWWYWETRGHFAEGQQWLQRTLALHDGPETLLWAQARWRAGALAYRRRDLDEAEIWLGQALTVLQAHGHAEGIAWCQAFLGLVALVRGEPAQARVWHEGALAAARLAGSAVVEAGSLSNLGEVAHAEGNLREAVRFYRESMVVARDLPDKLIAARSQTNLAIVEAERGNWRQAFIGHQEALRSYQVVGESRGVASSLEGMAGALARCREAREAVRLFGAAASLRQRMGAPMAVVERAAYENGIRIAEAALTTAEYADAWTAGFFQDTAEIVRAVMALQWPDPDSPEFLGPEHR
jgi:non-specific serine/threonine protein kinase